MTAPPLIVEATCEFLRRHAPFDRMVDDVLTALIPKLQLAYFAKDMAILDPQQGPVTHLHIIQRGLVGPRTLDTDAEPEPTLGPGELFPVGALSSGGATTRVYHAVQDTFCYLLERNDVLALRRDSPQFERYWTQTIAETLKQSLSQLQSQYSQLAAEQQTLTRPLSELIRRLPVTAQATAPLVDALNAMRDATVRTIVVVDDAQSPVGIFTLIDLLGRVVLPGKSLAMPVRDVMTSPAVTLPSTATAYEALQVMADRGIRQLIVVDGQRVVGLVSERDLFSLQRISMRQVSQTLRQAEDGAGLTRAADDIRRLTQNLLAQGAAAEPLTRTISSLNDALSRRVIELALGHHDLADCDWCWLALGSEGRGEQTFATDQDNALVFVAPETGVASVRARLIAFAKDVNAGLDAAGFPLCSGNVMASNPALCLTVEEWQTKFLTWIREPTPEALLQANILFDFRPLYGDRTLVDTLREWLHGYTREGKIFLRLMAQNALEADAPLGLIRAFATDDEPPHKGTIDLKTRGTRLFVDAARVFALAEGLGETNTAARLREAGRKLNIEDRHVSATIDAFHFLQMQRLRQQDFAVPASRANRIDPYQLNEVDQRMLKEAFRQARKLQQRLQQTYHL